MRPEYWWPVVGVLLSVLGSVGVGRLMARSQDRRTVAEREARKVELQALQPKVDAERFVAEAERQKTDIETLRGIIEALRQARDDDRVRFAEQVAQLHKDAADTKLEAVGAHHEACEAHKQAQRAQRALHEQRVWYTTKDLAWHQAVLAIVASLDPNVEVPPLPDPPLWPPLPQMPSTS